MIKLGLNVADGFEIVGDGNSAPFKGGIVPGSTRVRRLRHSLHHIEKPRVLSSSMSADSIDRESF